MLTRTTLVAVLLAAGAALAQAPSAPLTDAMRGATPLGTSTTPPPLGNQENKDERRTRGWAMQPPTIPHKIDGYQVDRNANRCLFCHARAQAAEAKAVPVSSTHYADRDGTVRGDLSPRRYFCTQCHVPQDDVKPLVGNTFQDFDTVRAKAAAKP